MTAFLEKEGVYHVKIKGYFMVGLPIMVLVLFALDSPDSYATDYSQCRNCHPQLEKIVYVKGCCETAAAFTCAPGMGDNLAVKVRCGLGSGNH